MQSSITTHTVEGPTGRISFMGRLLGTTESYQPGHSNHAGEHARKGERCYACRWSEYRVYRVDELTDATRAEHGDRYEGRYLVVSYGYTNVPNETTFRRVTATFSPAEVIELLTTRKYGQQPVITSAAARLLARCSDMDPDLQEAWDNRVVL